MTTGAFKNLRGSKQLNASAAFRQTLFENTYNELSQLLDAVKASANKGKSIGGGLTDEGTRAYGDASKKAREALKKVIDGLKPEEIGYLSGLGFRTLPLPPPPAGFPPPPAKTQDQVNREDVLSSPLFAWDKAAAAYASNKSADGDAARAKLLERLREFDAAIKGQGNPPVKPDA